MKKSFNEKNYKILRLNLKYEPFEVMITGEKNVEYRDIKPWVNSRLFNKDNSHKEFDYVKIMHAYSGDNPYFFCEFKGIKKVKGIHKKYSNGFEIHFDDERWGIQLGDIVFRGNI